MNEVRQTTIGILALYVSSTLIFLGIIFGTWYFGEINALKNRSFHDSKKLIKRLISVAGKKGEYANYLHTPESIRAVLQAISLQSGKQIMVFNLRGNLIYNNTQFSPREIPTKEGVYIIDNRVILNTFGIPDFLFGDKKQFRGLENLFRIVVDGGNIKSLLWDLRLKIWGLFGFFSLMISIVGFFLVRLSLRPVHQKFKEIDNFIKDTTHEINTPLSVLQMGVEQIDQKKIPQEELKKIHYIQLASKTLTNLYNSLVYASFGRVEKQMEKIDVKQLVLERLDFFSMLFKQKKISYRVELDSVWLKGDKNSIMLVIDNLLSNACKYTQKGGEIEIFLSKKDGEGLFWVKDNGYGIAPQDLPKIFNRYERFNPSNGGFGLGLNIVKKICDDMGIKLICQSELGKGSRFILSWKLEKIEISE